MSALGTVAVLVALLGVISGCSDTPSSSSGARAATPSELDDACAAMCARNARCNASSGTNGDAGASCGTDCLGKLGALRTSLRSDVVRGLGHCYTELACGMNDDRCTADALTFAGLSVDAAVHAGDVEACFSKHEECKGTPGEFVDDECGILPLLVDERRRSLAKCFDGSCDAVAACLKSEMGS